MQKNYAAQISSPIDPATERDGFTDVLVRELATVFSTHVGRIYL
jgi:hypothetical protein